MIESNKIVGLKKPIERAKFLQRVFPYDGDERK
jgi:hypothetical protein